jgi:hypothetical protein
MRIAVSLGRYLDELAPTETDAKTDLPTFGHAAKLVAVYLKSMVVLDQPYTPPARVAYPPIDRPLLQKLARAPHIQSPYKREWAKGQSDATR